MTLGQAVAFHFLFAQLLDNGTGYHFGDDFELAMLQAVIDDETYKRTAVHGQTFFGGLAAQVGFGFAGKRGIVPEQTAIVIGVHKHRVQRGGVLLACADHCLATHLLFRFFGYLNR